MAIGRLTRVLLTVATLALVFAPGSLTADHEPSPGLVSAAVLAPTDDGSSMPAARAREVADAFSIFVVVAIAIRLQVGARRWRSTAHVALVLPQHRSPSIRRRGPPSVVA